VKISYSNSKLEQLYSDPLKLQKKIGFDLAKCVVKRIDQFTAATTFGMYLQTGFGKPHPLVGNLDGCFGISLTGNIRIIVKPLIETKEISEINKCKNLEIGGIVDYHGEKENWIIK